MPNFQFYRNLFFNKSNVVVFLAFGMVGGFMAGRAILSMSMALFGLVALWGIHPKSWLKQKWWVLGLLWVGMYAISFFWSENIPYWNERLQVKLPFLLLPLSFALLPAFSVSRMKYFTLGVMIMLFVGCLYSLSFLWKDPESIINGYFTSKVMPTPAYRDHIRFSIFISWFVIWCFYIFPYFEDKRLKAIVVAAIAFFIIYLHVLAVKSGLLVFYLFLALYGIYYLLKRKWVLGGILITALVLIAYTAFKLFPSFEYKVAYMKYTYEEYERGGMSGNFSDMGRIISYNLASKIVSAHPLKGVGAGDMLDEMKQGYDHYYPQVPGEQRLIPHNQLLVVTIACGIPGLLLFLAWLFYPLMKVRKTRGGFFILVTWTVLFIAMLVEPMLEVQFGVFVYLFCILWMWKAGSLTRGEKDLPAEGRPVDIATDRK